MFRDTGVESLTLAIELFNRPSPIAREHAVVMMLAHAFEMLLKAAIFERRGTVRDKGRRAVPQPKAVRLDRRRRPTDRHG